MCTCECDRDEMHPKFYQQGWNHYGNIAKNIMEGCKGLTKQRTYGNIDSNEILVLRFEKL